MKSTSLLISISFVVRSTLAIVCLECRGLVQPYECTTVTECSTNEVCYIEKYETSNGQKTSLYNVGCKPLNFCSSSGPILPVIGKRSASKRIDRTTCHECCSDKDICNLEGHCGSKSVTLPVGSTICYSCPLAMDPNKCNHIALCDSACSLTQTRNLIGQPRWTHGCSEKSQCATIAQSNPQGVCSFCCDTELCNRNCTTKSTKAPPTTTTAMAPTTPIAHAKIRCLEGVRLTSPLDTTIVTECGDHEICYVERYFTNDGIIMYNVGCKDRQYCMANPLGKRIANPVGLSKRAETVICRHCCDDKDLCNMNQCGARVNLPVGSTICYACPLALDANKCNHITLCDQDSACSIKQTQNLIGQARWSHGCSEKMQCASIAQSNSQGICSFCCDTVLCNRNCTIKSTMAQTTPIPLTAPIITQTVIRPTNIKYGDTVTIQCISTGNPKPTIDFLVRVRRLGANVHVDPTTHILIISNFLSYDEGLYRCISSNSLGYNHKDFNLQGH